MCVFQRGCIIAITVCVYNLFFVLLLICVCVCVLQANVGVRRFAKPPESLERSLEMSRQKGRKRTQKRPNYKNVGEEEEEERGGGGADEGPEEEKAKGTEASSKGSRTSGDTEGEWRPGETVGRGTQATTRHPEFGGGVGGVLSVGRSSKRLCVALHLAFSLLESAH